jgi:hypothetical protein
MKNLSRFDIGMIIAFAVVTLLGFGAWYYLSGQLQNAQQDVTAAKADFDKLSVAKSGQDSIIVSGPNGQILQSNIDLINGQIDPLIESKLQPKDDKLKEIVNKDPVAWKHDLDDEVKRLTDAAKVSGVTLPDKFYFSFDRYLSQSPNDEQTAVLSKQLLAVDLITSTLINAHVKNITSIRRTYEEDYRPPANGGPGNNQGNPNSSSNQVSASQLAGFSMSAEGNVYTAYPFEFDFETAPENLRKIMDDFIQSPYIIVVRTLSIENTIPGSAKVSDLAKIAAAAAPPPVSMSDSSPGDVAAATPTLGPQHLFGYATLKVKARIDLIQWNAVAP